MVNKINHETLLENIFQYVCSNSLNVDDKIFDNNNKLSKKINKEFDSFEKIDKKHIFITYLIYLQFLTL